ncbi:MAG: DUF2726 domain-containing protein [Chthoniobacter sp.]|nr:DUF2726 domain-containing protein [Chthoniobacter sp.]
MKLLVNRYEEITYERLDRLTKENGAHVFGKTRVADVLPINDSNIPRDDFSYALKSHFDFTVTDGSYEILFAVEFDGPSHKSAIQRERDLRKNRLCERFSFPILRINANYLDLQFRGMDLLTYFVEVWFMSRAFDDMLERGVLGPDADFDPSMIVLDPKRKERFPFWLSADVQINLQKLQKKKVIRNGIPRHWIGIDGDENYRCLGWLDVTASSHVVIETGMRAQQFPIVISDVLQQISIFDLWAELQRVLAGESIASTQEGLRKRMERYGRYRKVSYSL